MKREIDDEINNQPTKERKTFHTFPIPYIKKLKDYKVDYARPVQLGSFQVNQDGKITIGGKPVQYGIFHI